MTETSLRSGSKQDWLLGVGLFCFFFSGAAGLLYQVVWTRMLTQIFGNTTYAIATVLSAFMAGLALGGCSFCRLAGPGEKDFFFFWVLPPPRMGAPLPVLSRFFVHSFTHLGRRVGDLYATNTMGAVLGCGFAGYYLIPTLGMRATVYTAAAVNLLIAAMIFIVDFARSKEAKKLDTGAFEREAAESGTGAAPSSLGWGLLLGFGLSGFAAMGYENAWTRALTLV